MLKTSKDKKRKRGKERKLSVQSSGLSVMNDKDWERLSWQT